MAELEMPNRLFALRYFIGAPLPFIFLWVAVEKGFEGQSYRALACLGAALLSFIVAAFWDRIIPARFRDDAKELEYLRTEQSFIWVALPFTFSFIGVERFFDRPRRKFVTAWNGVGSLCASDRRFGRHRRVSLCA